MAIPNVTILYGSETGTAQDIAEQIWKRSKRYNLMSTVYAMDEYNIENLMTERIMVFVVATAGQGDTPINMKNFWKFLLRKNIPIDFLKNLKYGVLGLGDSSFEKFNFAAKKLNKRLMQLGATEIVSIGLADDQHDLGLDAVFGPWTTDLFKSISAYYSLHYLHIEEYDQEVVERFNIEVMQENNYNQFDSDIYLFEAEQNDKLIVGTVIENSRTTDSTHFQDVRMIKFKINPNIGYKPGDVIYIKAKNSDQKVSELFNILNKNGVILNPNTLIRVTEKEIKLPVALQPILSLKQIAQQYWDLSFKPKRSTMQTLAQISENPLEKEKLIEFTTASGQEDFYNYINRPRRNILEVLNDFPHTTSKLTLNLLFEVFSPIKPRAFSIASSSKCTNDEIHILVAVVNYKTKLSEARLGLCSNWLASLNIGQEAVFWIQKGTFKFNFLKPMILIGPGTGLAPFRSVLLEKAYSNQDLSICILFFGCRYENKDYHCKGDLEHLERKFALKLHCAFSRSQENKIYVQHLISKYNALCWQFLQSDGVIYLAGSAKNMPNAVREEFVKIAEKCGKMNSTEAENFIRNLEKCQRYQVETW